MPEQTKTEKLPRPVGPEEKKGYVPSAPPIVPIPKPVQPPQPTPPKKT